jgi:hypothetical protein
LGKLLGQTEQSQSRGRANTSTSNQVRVGGAGGGRAVTQIKEEEPAAPFFIHAPLHGGACSLAFPTAHRSGAAPLLGLSCGSKGRLNGWRLATWRCSRMLIAHPAAVALTVSVAAAAAAALALTLQLSSSVHPSQSLIYPYGYTYIYPSFCLSVCVSLLSLCVCSACWEFCVGE